MREHSRTSQKVKTKRKLERRVKEVVNAGNGLKPLTKLIKEGL